MHVLLSLALACSPPDTTPDTDTAAADTGTVDTGTVDTSHIEGRPCPGDSIVTWQNFGQGFLLDNCVGCHSSLLDKDARSGAPLGADYETQAAVQANLAQLYQRSGDSNATMPPGGGGITEDTRHLFGEWLACGAP